MATQKTHYRLPLDMEFDKDVLDWIENFPSDKKGEMVRHAIRYYMALEGTSFAFPKMGGTSQAHEYRQEQQEEQEEVEQVIVEQPVEEEKPKRKKPSFKI